MDDVSATRPIANSIALWLRDAQQGDQQAIAALWRRYFPQLERFAAQKMARLGVPQRTSDGEDVAASALGSFFRALEQKRFFDLEDEQGLQRFLFKIAVWKVIDRKRRRHDAGESAMPDGCDSFAQGLAQLQAEQLPPDLLAVWAEQGERLLALLGDDQLRAIAEYRLEGYQNREIATFCNCSLATVERRVRLIRETWAESLAADET